MSPDLKTHCLFTTCKTGFIESTATGEGRNSGHGGEMEKERKAQRDLDLENRCNVSGQCEPSLTAEPSHSHFRYY